MSGGQQKPATQQTTVEKPPLPSVGRVVHYYSSLYRNPDEPRAAIVTEIGARKPDENGEVKGYLNVGLAVFRPYREVEEHGEHPMHIVSAPFSEQPADGCWSWPPKVGA